MWRLDPHPSRLLRYTIATTDDDDRIPSLQLRAGRGGGLRCGARDMTDYETFADGNESGSEAGVMARYVMVDTS